MSLLRREGYDEKRARIRAEMAERAAGLWIDEKTRRDPWSRDLRVVLSLNKPFPWIRWETPT